MSEQTYRLKGYNYSKARPYMVTLKKHPHAAPFSELKESRALGLRYTDITKSFVATITQRCIEHFQGTVAIRRFIIMPDHIHLLIHLNPKPGLPRPNLVPVVGTIIKFLTEAYIQIKGPCNYPPIDPYWHDSIAFTPDAVERMKRYIDQNPHRANLRKSTDFCKRHTYQAKDGKTWWYYGNLELVKRPTILPVECSRKILPGSELWDAWQRAADYIRSGCAGIGTFMSPCEKMVQSTILSAGGALIILLPEGISPYWHPGEEMEKFCAAGCLLYLTPFEAERARPSAATLYQRCHAGGGLKEIIAKIACNITAPPRE